MDERAIIRAAEITMLQAILERFPPGRERETWLEWLAVVSVHHLAPRVSKAYGPAALQLARVPFGRILHDYKKKQSLVRGANYTYWRTTATA